MPYACLLSRSMVSSVASDIQIAIVRRRNGARLGPRGPLPAVELPNCGDVSSYEMPRNLRIYRIMHFIALWPASWLDAVMCRYEDCRFEVVLRVYERI